MRTCVVCRRRAPATELVRVRAGGVIGPGSGRGAWLCRGPGCIGSRQVGAALSRALRAALTGADVERLRRHPGFGNGG